MEKADSNRDILVLILKSILGTIDPAGKSRLDEWRRQSREHERIYAWMSDIDNLESEYIIRKSITARNAYKNMQTRISRERRHRLYRRVICYAAAVLVLVGVAVTWHALKETATDNVIVSQTYADGDSQKKAVKAVSSPVETVQKVQTPTGSSYKLRLEDGTEVWLNSRTRLDYPAHFAKTSRTVSLSGEAFFHVSRDKSRPFYVNVGESRIKVYGTSFSVRALENEEKIYVTLLEGKVSVETDGSQEVYMRPNEMLTLDKGDLSTKVKTVNAKLNTSWRNNKFVFENHTLGQIMTDLGSWYGVKVRFADDSLRNITYVGSVPRYKNIEDVLEILRMSGNIKFTKDNNTIFINK